MGPTRRMLSALPSTLSDNRDRCDGSSSGLVSSSAAAGTLSMAHQIVSTTPAHAWYNQCGHAPQLFIETGHRWAQVLKVCLDPASRCAPLDTCSHRRWQRTYALPQSWNPMAWSFVMRVRRSTSSMMVCRLSNAPWWSYLGPCSVGIKPAQQRVACGGGGVLRTDQLHHAWRHTPPRAQRWHGGAAVFASQARHSALS